MPVQMSALHHFTWSPHLPLENELLDRLVDRILVIFTLVGSVALIFSMLRASSTGWLNLYTFHIVLYSGIVVITLLRQQLSSHIKAIILVAVNLIIAMIGYHSLGMIAAGVFFLPIAGVILALFYNRWMLMTFVIISLIYLTIIASGFITGKLQMVVSADKLMMTSSHWIVYGISMAIFLLTTIMTIIGYRSTVVDLVNTLEGQRDEITQLANHDELTRLPTQRLAKDRLQMALYRAQRSNQKAAILFVDLDDFKKVNDTFGHDAGDHCLRIISDRLLSNVRAEDTVARIGGDEFLIIVENLADLNSVATLARSLIDNLSKSISWREHIFTVGASIGISLFPDHGTDGEVLKRKADKAMYTVKNRGKNNYSFA